MGFLKDEMELPLTTPPPPPPQSPPSGRRLKLLGWGFCLISLVILHLIFFLTITFPSFFSLLPNPPTFHLTSAELNVISLDDGDWKLDFNISNPPGGPYISFTPISASVIYPVRHVILADTHDVVTPTRGSALTIEKADVIQAQARLFSPPNQTLDDAVLKRNLDDRAHGFLKFDVEIKVSVVFARNLPVPIPIPIPDMEREYRVDCKGLEFYFADEEGKEGVAKIAPGMC